MNSTMKAYFAALFCWQALNLAAVCAALSPHPVVVLIAFDGIPQEYLQSGHSPFLQVLAKDSTTTEWMLHQFPQRTLANLQSIATGLYPDSHGILGDHTFAGETNECIAYGEKMYTQKANITPIWTLNELSGNGRHSGVVAWPGAEFSYRGTAGPTFRIKSTDCKTWEQRVDDAVAWLTDGQTPANLVLLHFEAGHNRTAESVPLIMRRIDQIIRYYFDQLTRREIGDKVNTIILSDHTLTNQSVGVMPECRRAQIAQDVSSCHAEISKSLQQASTELNTFKVTQYAKLKSNFQNGEISQKAEQYLVAQQNKLFVHPKKFLRTLGQEEHNSSMFPLFIANGPLFEPDFIATPFENIDIYALVSHVLNLTEPIIPINGSFQGVKDVLMVRNEPLYKNIAFKMILFFIVGLLLLVCAWYILRIRQHERLRL